MLTVHIVNGVGFTSLMDANSYAELHKADVQTIVVDAIAKKNFKKKIFCIEEVDGEVISISVEHSFLYIYSTIYEPKWNNTIVGKRNYSPNSALTYIWANSVGHALGIYYSERNVQNA